MAEHMGKMHAFFFELSTQRFDGLAKTECGWNLQFFSFVHPKLERESPHPIFSRRRGGKLGCFPCHQPTKMHSQTFFRGFILTKRFRLVQYISELVGLKISARNGGYRAEAILS